jgi:hypothetical protein
MLYESAYQQQIFKVLHCMKFLSNFTWHSGECLDKRHEVVGKWRKLHFKGLQIVALLPSINPFTSNDDLWSLEIAMAYGSFNDHGLQCTLLHINTFSSVVSL